MSAPTSSVRPDPAVAASSPDTSDDTPDDIPDDPGPQGLPPAGSGASMPIRIGLDLGARWIALCAELPGGGTGGGTGEAAGAEGRLVCAATPTGREPLTLDGLYELLASAAPELSPARLAQHPLEVTITTTATARAVLRQTGGPIALVTTAGFEDTLRLGQAQRERAEVQSLGRAAPPRLPTRLDAAEAEKLADALCPSSRTFGLRERLSADGQVATAPDAAALDGLRQQIAAAGGVSAVAVALLHSYRDPRHEEAAAAALSPLGLPLVLSSAVWPHPREYERTLATVLDAYLRPVEAELLGGLTGATHPAGLRLRIVLSDGTARLLAGASPLRAVLGGPAASLLGARRLAAARGETRLLVLSIGATLTTAARCDGDYALTTEPRLGPLQLPPGISALEQVTIDLGSASRYGADGRGQLCPMPAPTPEPGHEEGPTATLGDALCALGVISDTAHERSLPTAQAALALLGARLGGSAEATAQAICAHAEAELCAALAAVSLDAGFEPADYALLPLGGVAPALGERLAAALGTRPVICLSEPQRVGALGALLAQVVRSRRQALGCEASGAEHSGLVARTLAGLVAAVQADLADEGIAAAGCLRAEADLRYRGQPGVLTLPLSLPQAAAPELAGRFVAAHVAAFGFALDAQAECEIELVELRVIGALAPLAPPALR